MGRLQREEDYKMTGQVTKKSDRDRRDNRHQPSKGNNIGANRRR